MKRMFEGTELQFTSPPGSEIVMENFYHEEEYVLRLVRAIKELHPPEDAVIYDIGAQYGATALALATTGLGVVAFEPYPPFQDVLRLNLDANPWAKITLVEAAVTEKTEAVMLYGELDRPPMPALLQTQNKVIPHKDPLFVVQGVSLADLPHAFAIKIDVEGAENRVLRSMPNRPALLGIEFHPLVQEPDLSLIADYDEVYEVSRGYERLTLWSLRK